MAIKAPLDPQSHQMTLHPEKTFCSHPRHQVFKFVFHLVARLNDNTSFFSFDGHTLLQVKVRQLHRGGTESEGRAIAPFANHCFHVAIFRVDTLQILYPMLTNQSKSM
jgi:hypothetical protein